MLIGKYTRLTLKLTHRYFVNVAYFSDLPLRSSMDISGIYPPVTTTFNADEEIDLPMFTKNIQIYNKIPFRGYVVLGSNGECPLLSIDEKLKLLKAARDAMPAEKLLIAGAGFESTLETIKFCQQCKSVGVDAALIYTPSYFKNDMNGDALYHHFKKIADSISLPVILYNIPACTGIDMDADTIVKLANHPNIIGLKDSGGNIAKLARIVYDTRDLKFSVLAGSAGFLLPALQAGCVGGVCAFANILGNDVCRLYELFKEKDCEAARVLQARLVEPNAMVTRVFGVPALKKVMDLFGYYGGPVRSPLLPLNENNEKKIMTVFNQYGFEKKL